MNSSLLDKVLSYSQDCLKQYPVLVLGSGFSIPYGLPSMSMLADHLCSSVKGESLSNTDELVWDEFLSELAKSDLESALQSVNLNEYLSNIVIRSTWKLVSEADNRVFGNILANNNHLPLSRLYRFMFNSTHQRVSVVTTNYDRLAEYAADEARVVQNKGFGLGYVSTLLPHLQPSISCGNQGLRIVDIWKVHGCLDWFNNGIDEVVAVKSARNIPLDMSPTIVTPGVEKYQRTHLEPFRSILTKADEALSEASAFLCIGFGFNDEHIQPKLIDRWRNGDARLVILTKRLTERAKHLICDVHKSPFMVFEYHKRGTRLITNDSINGELLEGVSLWKLSDFLDYTI